jgi:phosphotransferase system IIB component
MQSQKKMNFPMPLHRKHCKEGATVVTQFWIHQDFLECYFISIIIYKNPKKLRKSLKFKNIFLESTASFRQNRVHQVNTGQTMSTRVKNEFRAVSGQNRHFRQNRVHQVNTGQTMSTRVKNEFRAVSGQNRHFLPKPSSSGQYGSNHVNQDKK